MGRVHRPRIGLIAALVAMGLYAPTVVSAQTAKMDLSDPASLPAGLYPALIAAVQSDAPTGYEVVRRNQAGASPGVAANAYRAPNPAHKFDVDFGTAGITLRARETEAWHLGMTLVGYGHGRDIRPVPPARMHIDGNRVEYRRGGRRDGSRPALTEWYLNGPLGLEQGFTLASPPPGDGKARGDLILVLALSGGLVPALAEGGQAVRLTRPEQRAALRYGGLYAYDATGRQLPAWMVLAVGTLSIEVDAAEAVYPVTIDPLLSEETKIIASDGAADDQFGSSVAISGDTVVVGQVPNTFAVGSAYVFVRSGGVWLEQQKLTASDAEMDDLFGGSVAIDGDTLVVASVGNDDSGFLSGAAYVFVREGGVWSEQQKLTGSDTDGEDQFGSSVAISDDTVVVGAIGNNDVNDIGEPVSASGSAYVFVRVAGVWSEQQKLTANDAEGADAFGRSVAINGETVVTGAPGGDDAGDNSGSAYVFTRSGTIWSEQQKLAASEAEADDRFGESVDIYEDTAVVGATREDDAADNAGAAYVFTRSGNTWSEQQKLTAADAEAGDAFGASVAISGDTAVIGASFDDHAGTASGSAYVFVRSGGLWSEQQKLTASDAEMDDLFGTRVAIDGDTIAVAMPGDDDAGDNSGAAYIYELDVDSDSVANVSDNCPANFNPGQEDSELDGAGDVCDPDDDNDGMPDIFEAANEFDPFDPSDAGQDADGDGFTNLEEFRGRSDPHDPNSIPKLVSIAPILQLLLLD